MSTVLCLNSQNGVLLCTVKSFENLYAILILYVLMKTWSDWINMFEDKIVCKSDKNNNIFKIIDYIW